jgi:hypothetical protein
MGRRMNSKVLFENSQSTNNRNSSTRCTLQQSNSASRWLSPKRYSNCTSRTRPLTHRRCFTYLTMSTTQPYLKKASNFWRAKRWLWSTSRTLTRRWRWKERNKRLRERELQTMSSTTSRYITKLYRFLESPPRALLLALGLFMCWSLQVL